MAVFSRDPNPAVQDAFLGQNDIFTTLPVQTRLLGLAKLDVWTFSVIRVFREIDCPEDRRQNEYSDAFGRFLLSATTQLVGAVSRFAEYWRRKELEVSTCSISLGLGKNFVFDISCSATRIASFASLF